MSNRVMLSNVNYFVRSASIILAGFTPALEIYSIDEAFLDLTDLAFISLDAYARTIRKTVKQNTGIPVSIGIGPTKTLAKIANRIAKKSARTHGVLDGTPENGHQRPDGQLQPAVCRHGRR